MVETQQISSLLTPWRTLTSSSFQLVCFSRGSCVWDSHYYYVSHANYLPTGCISMTSPPCPPREINKINNHLLDLSTYRLPNIVRRFASSSLVSYWDISKQNFQQETYYVQLYRRATVWSSSCSDSGRPDCIYLNASPSQELEKAILIFTSDSMRPRDIISFCLYPWW